MPYSALAQLLGNLAGYNDKGFEWSGHSPEQVEQFRREQGQEIARLMDRIGRERLPAALAQALESGHLLTDASGRYVKLAREDGGKV